MKAKLRRKYDFYPTKNNVKVVKPWVGERGAGSGKPGRARAAEEVGQAGRGRGGYTVVAVTNWQPPYSPAPVVAIWC